MHAVLGDSGLLDVNGTLIAEVLAFILMVLAFAKWVYPPIIRLAEQREKQIEAGVRSAQEAQQRLESAEAEVGKTLDAARAQARDIVGRAHSDAVVEAEEVRTRARSEAEALIARARSEIDAERDRAIQDLRNQVSSLVVEATARVLGEALDGDAQRRLIDDALTRVSADAGGRSARN